MSARESRSFRHVAGRLLTVRAAATVGLVLAARGRVSFDRLAEVLGVEVERTKPSPRQTQHPERFSAEARAVDRALAFWRAPAGQCLVRSLVLAHLLRRERARVRIGARIRGSTLEAHAWVEVDGGVVGEPLVACLPFVPLATSWSGIATESMG